MGIVEQEVVSTDASVYAVNVTGGLPGSGVDGSLVYRVCVWTVGQLPALTSTTACSVIAISV